MNDPISPFEAAPPTARRLYQSIGAALLGAAVLLILFVLPAEYGLDPTGLGSRLGLAALHESARTLKIQDVIGGNASYREVKVPDPGRPTPLPGDVVGWLETFAEGFLVAVPPDERPAFLAEVRDALRPALADAAGKWTADYVRLRFAARRDEVTP